MTKVQFHMERCHAQTATDYIGVYPFSECFDIEGTEADIERRFVEWVAVQSGGVPGTEHWKPVSTVESEKMAEENYLMRRHWDEKMER